MSGLYGRVAERMLCDARQGLRSWVAQARRSGVRADFVLDETLGSPAAEIVREGAAADLVVVAARSGPLESAVLGSTTRGVLRAATRPVLIFHP
jgi:nucleotide-binding universal stress UspA family protein